LGLVAIITQQALIHHVAGRFANIDGQGKAPEARKKSQVAKYLLQAAK
jgi:hypothetical protein